jgi:hypothetical protein
MRFLFPHECYSSIGTYEGNIQNLVTNEQINDSSQWFNYFDFKVMLLDNLLIERVPVFKMVNKVIKIDRIAVVSMPPMSTYNWHVDERRSATVNMLLNNHDDSICLFGKQIDGSKHSIVELFYKPNTFYLFNTSVDHMVINRGTERFMLSLQFEKQKKYEDLREPLTKGIDQVSSLRQLKSEKCDVSI